MDSGTSFSSPHVAGALARLVSQVNGLSYYIYNFIMVNIYIIWFTNGALLARLVSALSQHRASSLQEVQGILLNSTLKGVIEGVPKGTANKMLHKAC